MNIIKLLGIEYKEDIISNFIVVLINESKAFRDSFLKNIVKIEYKENIDVKAHTRIKTSFGIPDIIISAKQEKESTLIIIENKLKAEEGENQTSRYNNEKCTKELMENKKIFESDVKNINVKFIFLTLIPEKIQQELTLKILLTKIY